MYILVFISLLVPLAGALPAAYDDAIAWHVVKQEIEDFSICMRTESQPNTRPGVG